MSKTPTFKGHQNKENLFIQVASKKSHSSVPQKSMNREIYKFADEHYDELLSKISTLDRENQKLREIIKKSNYVQFQFVDVSHSKIDPEFHSLSDIKNKSLEVLREQKQLSYEDVRQLSTPRGGSKQGQKATFKQTSLAAKQVQYQKQRNSLISNYAQELTLQEQLDYNVLDENQDCQHFSSEIYRGILQQVINKDGKIFKKLDQVIQSELSTNFKQNHENYQCQNNLLESVLKIVERMIDYCEGNHPDNMFIMRAYRSLRTVIEMQKRIYEKIKLQLIPLNTMVHSLAERSQDFERLQFIIEESNSKILEAEGVISQLIEQNKSLKEENLIFQDCFTQISYSLQQNENLKFNLDQILQKAIKELLPFQPIASDQTPAVVKQSFGLPSLAQELIEIKASYSKIREKGNRNKLKFSKYLNEIFKQLNEHFAGFDLLTIEEKVQVIQKTIQQKQKKSVSEI